MLDLFQKLSLTIASFVTGATVAGNAAMSTPRPLITPSPSPKVVEVPVVVRSGEYAISGQSVKYLVNIPKNGGEIKGNITGTCDGPISGNFDGNEGGKIEGRAKASCGIAFIRQNIEVSYTGNLYLKQGRADLNWTGDIPFSPSSGSFSIYFEPVN